MEWKLFFNFSETKTNTMDYKIVKSSYPEGLVSKVKSLMEDGWKPMGGHSVVGTFFQDRYTGSQHHSTSVEVEYSQTMVKEEP